MPLALRAAGLDPRVPSDCEWVLQVNVRRFLEAPVVKKHGTAQVGAGLQQALATLRPVADLGLDPLRNVSQVTLAGSGLLEHDRALVIAHGNFDRDKIQAAAERLVREHPDHWKCEKQGDVRVYEVREKGLMTPLYLAFADRETLVLSRGKQYVQAALAADASKPVKVSRELQALIEKADDRESLWLAALPPERVKRLLARTPQTAGIAEQITAFSGSVLVADDLRLALRVHLKDARSTEEVSQLLEAGRGFAVFAVHPIDGVGPLLADLLEACKTSIDRTTVSLSGRLAEEQIAKHLRSKMTR
jgi:hypothetical protein